MARLYSRTVLLALGLGFATFATQAGAGLTEPEIKFHPAKTWAVKSGSDFHCSIANEFNNGFTLRFDGFENSVDALNIDFLQDAFEAGQAYTATISVPGISKTSLSAQAGSANVLTISLTGAPGLYKAMRDSSVFDIDVSGNTFRFYLSGFAAAAGAFESCMGAGNTTRDAAAKPAAMPAQKTAEAMQTATAAATPIQAESSAIEKTALIEPAASDDHTDSNPAWDPEGLLAKDGGGKIAPAQSESLAFNDKQSFGAAQKTEPGKESAAPMPVADAPFSHVEPVKTANPLPRAERTPEPVVHTKKTTFTADFTGNDRMEEDSNAPFRTARADPEMARKISELESVVAKLEKENLALNSELKSSLSESHEERVSIASENWNLERATMRYNEAERQIKKLGEQLQRERMACNTEKHDLEGMLFDPQVTSQEQMAKLGALEQKLAAAQTRIRELETRLGTQ